MCKITHSVYEYLNGFTLVIFSLVVSDVSCLKCFDCHSATDRSCRDTFFKDKQLTMVCENAPSMMCGKRDFQGTIWRGCERSGIFDDTCKSLDAKCYSCSKDLCNSGMRIDHLLLPFPMLVLILSFIQIDIDFRFIA